jgi:Holliday junction resolvase
MTPEKKVKNAVKKILDRHGVYYFFPATHGYGSSGVPDIVVCANGKFLAIECKAGRNTTTALQDIVIERIRASKGVALVVNEDNVADVEGALQQIFI